MEPLLKKVLKIVGIVFAALSLLFYAALLYAVFAKGYTFFYAAEQDVVVLMLLTAVLIFQCGLLAALLKHKLLWLAVPIALICWITLFQTARTLHKLPAKATEGYWENVGEKLFPRK